MKFLLVPVAKFFELVVCLRNAFYETRWVRTIRVPFPVVSVGNLTVGGTGKTPITQILINQCRSDQKKIAVISRSYLGSAKTPCEVNLDLPQAPKVFGDEPVLLKQKNPDIRFFVGSEKWKTLEFAATQEKFDLAIIDDGFQHRRIERDLDIVVLDALEDENNYQLFPVGRAREPWKSLERADLVLINKCNLVSDQKINQLKSQISSSKSIITLGYEIKKIFRFSGDKEIGVEELLARKVFLLAGIGRPEIFEKMMKDLGADIRGKIFYRDHHQYTDQDMHHILRTFQASGAEYLITTEKDQVKLQDYARDHQFFWSASLTLSEIGQKGRLSEVLRQLYR